MNKRYFCLVLFLICSILFLNSCNYTPLETESTNSNSTAAQSEEATVAGTVSTEKTEIPTDLEESKNTLNVVCLEGTDNCWSFSENTLLFSGISADTVCSVSGEFDGHITIDCPEDYKFELALCGVTLYSATENPITVLGGDEITVTAKKETVNYIYDQREAVSEDDENAYSAAIWSNCDLEIGGKGELTLISSHNNGIHTKDDLQIKNLTLTVTCEDNALKGNDSVEITSGTITLIAKTGDGIKTTNTDISQKGKQRGTVSISGGTVTVYAACDGIDAAYDADISEEAVVNIYTDRYSPYSENVESTTSENVRFIRFTSKNYSFSVKYYNSDTDYQWANATFYKSVSGGWSTYYYFSFDKLTNYEKVQIYIYSSTQEQGQEKDYLVQSDYLTWNNSYDTFALEQRGNSLSYNWANYTTSVNNGGGGPGGMGGGPGGMSDGNSDKGDYSTKGIKSGNEIHITGGTVTVESYDDSLHTNSEGTLENGSTPTGNILVSGGSLTLFSKDDGIHADGTLTITGGTVKISNSYEGLEGNSVRIEGGDISIISSDDGINATATSGIGIDFEGGTVYIYAGGDGIDANSRTSYKGIVFAGGLITIVSTTSMNSSIDTEQGYTYTGGTVLALCPSNGMGSESSNCQNFSSIGCKTTMSLKNGQTLLAKINGNTTVSLTMPCALSALVIYLGSNSATFSTGN